MAQTSRLTPRKSTHPLAVCLRRIGVTHDELADECDLSQAYVSLVCARRRRLAPTTAQKVERALLRLARERGKHGVVIPGASELVFARTKIAA